MRVDEWLSITEPGLQTDFTFFYYVFSFSIPTPQEGTKPSQGGAEQSAVLNIKKYSIT